MGLSIGAGTFYNCTKLASITIPDSVTSIGAIAFRDCKGLTSITILNSVTSIGFDAFKQCYGLTSITIGNGVTFIGEGAFQSCKALTKTKKGNRIRCLTPYCNYISNEKTEEEINAILNYTSKPLTKYEAACEELESNKEYADNDEMCGDYIDLDVAKEILKKYLE